MAHEIQRLEELLSFLSKPSKESPSLVSIETDSLSLLEHTIRASFKQTSPSTRLLIVSLNNEPYEPFLTIIRELINPLPPQQKEAIFSSLSVSLFVRDLLSSLVFEPNDLSPTLSFFDWYYEREEAIYFQKEIAQGIFELLLSLQKQAPVFILIRCSDTASYAFFDFLGFLLEKTRFSEFPLLLLMDMRLLAYFPEEQSKEWNTLFGRYQKDMYALKFYFSQSVLEQTPSLPPLPIEKQFTLLRLYEKSWAWRDVRALAEKILKYESSLSSSQKTYVLTRLAIALALEGSIDEAIFFMEKTISLQQEQNDTPTLLRSQILQAYFYLTKDAGRETALKIARHTTILCPPGEKQLKTLIQTLLFMCGDITEENFSKFLKTTVPSLKNIHPLFYMFVTSNYYFSIMLGGIFHSEKAIRRLKNSLSLSKKYGHLYRQTFFLHHIAIFYSRLYDYSKTVRFYKKSIHIRQKLGDLRRLCHAYNGFGYVYFAAENFSKAYYYYTKAIKLNIELRDYRELCMSLMNVVQLEMVLHNYDTAEELLSFLIELKKVLGIVTLPIHSNTKITTLHTYLLEKLGKFVPYYHQITEVILSQEKKLSSQTNEEYAYLQWLLARYYQRYIDPKKTINAYENAINYISREEFNYNELEIWYDYLLWLKKNQPALFETKKNEFQNRLESLRLFYYQNYLTERHVRPQRHHYQIPREHILETARLSAQISDVQRTLEHLDFMNQLQKTLLRQKDKHTLVTESMLLIKRYFIIDFAICYLGSFKDNFQKWDLIYSTHEPKHFPPDLYENLRGCFKMRKERLIVDLEAHHMKLLFPSYDSLMYFPLFIEEQEAGCIFFANRERKNAFSEQTFQTMHMAVKQINTMLTNIFYAEMLHHTAQTDILTGCANRLALTHRLEEEEERVKRSEDYNFSVVFTDMDNFKYYNDTFGHSVGDTILQEFAIFLRQNIRKVDLLGRFGGDEFVLILPDTNRQKALKLIQRVYQTLKEQKFFERMISQYTTDPIPEDKQLSISMGIADYRQAGNLHHLLEYADIALYEAKKRGKNMAIVYKN